jgi:hypothetical protein
MEYFLCPESLSIGVELVSERDAVSAVLVLEKVHVVRLLDRLTIMR